MRNFICPGLLAAGCMFASAAADPGSTVVVIYNSRMGESKDVAQHYAALRRVPADQVVGFDLPTGEDMTRAEYHDQLQEPLLKFLEGEKLLVYQPGAKTSNNVTPVVLKSSRIRYAVLCFGVPLRILDDPALSEPGLENVRPALRGRNGAAVDSELTVLPWSRQKMTLTGPALNPCFAATNAAQLDPVNGVLMVARLDGPTAAIARKLVDKAMEAETNGLWGRAYFDLRGLTNGPLKAGDDWIRAASEDARLFGFETVVDDKPDTFPAAFPMSQIALYAGWYDGGVSGPFTRPVVEFMPGAFAYHLHSFSAHTLRSTTENWCGPLLAKGVTATMGCVDEPYLEGTPDIGVFFHRWLQGFTFGEAACAAQHAISWETTVIGDPLYRPFGADPRVLNEQLVKRHSPLVEWSELRWVDLNLASGQPAGKFLPFLEAESSTLRSVVLTEKLAELYRAEGSASLAVKNYRQALALHPSPQQAVRLDFALADELTAAGKTSEALALYEDFLGKTPDYPDAPGLWRKMETLALKAGEKAKAGRYAAEIRRLSPAR